MTRQQIQELDRQSGAATRRRPRPKRVSLEVDRDKLFELLRARKLCAADFTCLDGESKDCVWRLALAACESPGEISGQ